MCTGSAVITLRKQPKENTVADWFKIVFLWTELARIVDETRWQMQREFTF